METDLKKVELFENLTQLEFDGNHYDFHNDFDCVKFSLENSSIMFSFKNVFDKSDVSLIFYNVDLVRLEFINLSESKLLTIDTIYRGRYEVSGGLIELSENGKSYVYFEFYEGQKGEFFSDRFDIKEAFTN